MKKHPYSPALAVALLAPMLASCAQAAPTTSTVPVAIVSPTSATQSFFFHDGDRAMITGDSITQQFRYSTLIESFVLSRFPNWDITFRNTGWSGDRADLRLRGGQENGLKRDLLPIEATAVTIDYGMNDARDGDKGYQRYVDTSRTLAQALTDAGARVALITSSPEEKYEAGQPAGSAYNLMLRKYSDGLKGVAAEKGSLFVDQLNPMISVIEAGRAAKVLSPEQGGPRLIPDGVHGNWAGHLVMATEILKGLDAPSLVSDVEIDAAYGNLKKAKTLVADNASVTKLSPINPVTITGDDNFDLPGIDLLYPKGGTLYFVRKDNALPWPLQKDTKLALGIPGFDPLGDLSRYELKIVNLSQPKYEVAIDGQSVGKFTKEELSAGVNLSDNAGPISAQGQELLKAILDKNNTYFTRWRQVQISKDAKWTGNEEGRTTELARLDAQIADQEKQINRLRQPRPHVWSLKPVA